MFWKLCELPQMISCMALAIHCYSDCNVDEARWKSSVDEEGCDALGMVLLSAISSGIMILITIYQNIRLCFAVFCEPV